jgi:hypothetical protein
MAPNITVARSNSTNGKKKSKAPAPEPASPPVLYHLTPEREAELVAEARSLGDRLVFFPGKLARRVAWSSRIQLAAERDATDFVHTPFPDGEPPLTHDEIHGLRDKIELLRLTQSRWQALQRGQLRATASFADAAAEAAQHRQTLLRFFDLRFRNDPEGQRRLSAIRDGAGDADLVQDVSDLLVLCERHKDAISQAPRGEARAAARLAELSPMLSRLLADKTLSPEAQDARRLRDGAYTLVIHAERRLRTAAMYWYDGTDKLNDYAAFPTSRGAAAGAGAEDVEAEDPADEDLEAAPDAPPPSP